MAIEKESDGKVIDFNIAKAGPCKTKHRPAWIDPDKLALAEKISDDILGISNRRLSGIGQNTAGGAATKIASMMTEVPPLALLEIAQVLAKGDIPYPRDEAGRPNYMKLSVFEHLNHAQEHYLWYLTACAYPNSKIDKRKELSHFAGRAMMALEQYLGRQIPAEDILAVKK